MLYEKLFRYFSDPKEGDDVFYARSDTKFTYGQAGEVIRAISNYFDQQNIGVGDVVAIEAEKEFEVYCCCLACIINGITYVPFSKAQNFNRIKQSFSHISTDLIITVTDEAHNFFKGINIREISISAIEPSSQPFYSKKISEAQIAYIMFSSGTTGRPKAIPVTRKNLEAYIDSIESQYDIDYGSGFSQIAELTFDLSIHDIYLCISNKGFLCPIKSKESIFGHRFVNELEIGYWMSVPSTASYMFQMIPVIDSMPSLKCTFFLGEALSTDLAKKWIKLTPNGIAVNTYGPTECTVAAS
ncbi:AMP-binding protein, partial [bacterium]|nr:AMP-binding protein [bacterium]